MMAVSSSLDISNQEEVLVECTSCSANWEVIGSNLGLQPNVLATIKKKNPDNHEKCMSQIISMWLSKDETIVPTWNWLCHALYYVDRPTADKIAENHHVTDYNKLKDHPGISNQETKTQQPHASTLRNDPQDNQMSDLVTENDYMTFPAPVEEKKTGRTLSKLVIRHENALGHLDLIDQRVSDQSDPTTLDDASRVIIDPTRLKDLICDDKHRTLTNISLMLYIIGGLPYCRKSEVLKTLLRRVLLKSRDDTMTKVSENDERAGLSFYELAAVGLPPAPFDRLTYSKTTKHTSYLYAFQSALKHLYYSCGQDIIFHDPSAGEKEVIFNDKELNDHFYQIFKSLAVDQQQELSSPLSDTKWKRSIPNGIALINVWDIGLNKAVFHFLSALWGHLDNSYVWLFLDLDRDMKELYNKPSLPENTFNKARKDKDLVMQYRSRIEYLLRPAMLAKSSSHGDRDDVCSVFGVHSGTYEEIRLKGLAEEIENASAQANLATVVNTKEVTPINPDDDKCWEVLKRKADEITGAKLESTVQIPLASIFLRSLYYGVNKMYIKRSELKAKAKLLKMRENEFESFCKTFMSSGSIIDVSLIDKESEYVILQPTNFICALDKMFYPDTTDSRVAMCGIVAESTAIKIFDTDHKLFMDVLVSVDLALKLKSHQLTIESSEFTQIEEMEEYYYIPDVRITAPVLKCQPSALHLLHSTSCPFCHLQVLFAEALLKIKPDSKLVIKNASPVNITTFRAFTSEKREAIDFEMRYLGEAVEFRVPPDADEDICTAIVQSCHKIMRGKWGCEKYNFAVMCSNDPDPNTPSRLRRKRHLLPNDKLCETCVEKGRLDKMLGIWNTTLLKNPIKEQRKLNGEPITFDDIVYIADKLRNEVIKEDTLHKIATKLGFEEGLKNECFKDIDSWRIPFMMIFEWERRIKQSSSKEHSEEGASKRALARIIIEISDNVKDEKQNELLETLARKLDMKVTQARKKSLQN